MVNNMSKVSFLSLLQCFEMFFMQLALFIKLLMLSGKVSIQAMKASSLLSPVMLLMVGI